MRWISLSCAVLLLGCGAAPTPQPSATLPSDDTDALEALAAFALEADARMEETDSLFGPDAEIIAAGRRRTGAPRFAGIEAGGQVALGSIRVDQAGNFAWASFDYRWLAPDKEQFHEGRATVVFSRVATATGRGWRIAHLHSSLRQ
jgi:hypothetical protein